MSDHLSELQQRRAMLEIKSASQRQQLGAAVGSIEARLSGIEQGVGKARKLLQRPAVLAGGAVLGLLIGPRRLLRLAAQGTLAFAAVKKLLKYVRI